jgi:small subunit ribosomal protein S16
MPVKIRLARHGRKAFAYYHIVAADSRAPRDGKYIERLGNYNPNTNPATVELDFDKALDWLQKGAQPTDTCRAILKLQGVLFKNHLLNGVKKGAFSQEVVEQKFEAWMKEKESLLLAQKDNSEKSKSDLKRKRAEAEVKAKEARAEAIAKKNAAKAEETAAATAEEAPAAE